MKLHLALPLLLVGTRSGHAFVSQTPALRPATALEAQKNDWFRPAAVAMAGWAMAAQLTFAAPSESVTMLPGELQFGISTFFLDSSLTRSFWILALSYWIPVLYYCRLRCSHEARDCGFAFQHVAFR
jgi:hypothetical protein